MNKQAKTAFYARVKGKVQGVGFRYSAIREADSLIIKGWVRNAANGDVEVWAEGPKEKLELFLKWLRRGPQFSRVDSLEVDEREPQGYRNFDVMH